MSDVVAKDKSDFNRAARLGVIGARGAEGKPGRGAHGMNYGEVTPDKESTRLVGGRDGERHGGAGTGRRDLRVEIS